MIESVKIKNRLIPLDRIALIEPMTQTNLNSKRVFLSRYLLIDRDSVLSEEAPETLTEKHRFRMLSEDKVAINPTIRFNVEAFIAGESFVPTKPFKSRLTWKDDAGEAQSKLLLTAPENVLELVMSYADESPAPQKPPKKKRRAKQKAPEGPK